MNPRLVDMTKIVLGGGPILINATALTGDYFSFKAYRRCAVILALAPASGTDVAAVTLKQAKTVANSPATEKELAFTKMYKCAAPDSDDRLVETTVTSNTFNTSAAAAKELYVIEIDETDLDMDNDFDCFRINVSDPGSVSTPACAIYIGYGSKYPADVSKTPSAIID